MILFPPRNLSKHNESVHNRLTRDSAQLFHLLDGDKEALLNVKYYKGNGYSAFNECFYRPRPKCFTPRMKRLDRFMARCIRDVTSTGAGPITLFRCIHSRFADDLWKSKANEPIMNRSYSSWAFDRTFPDSYYGQFKDSAIMIKCRLRTGMNFFYIDGFSEANKLGYYQAEIILDKNCKYVVKKRYVDKSTGQRTVVVEYIGDCRPHTQNT